MSEEFRAEGADVASASECTGAMPALPADAEGAAREAQLLNLHPPKRKRRRAKRGPQK